MVKKATARVKYPIKKGDTVIVVSGKKNIKGKKGKVLRIIPDKAQVLIEGVNFVKRHVKPTAKIPQGGIQEKEAPVRISKVRLICNKCGEVTSIRRIRLDNGKRVRVCKKCGEVIDLV